MRESGAPSEAAASGGGALPRQRASGHDNARRTEPISGTDMGDRCTQVVRPPGYTWYGTPPHTGSRVHPVTTGCTRDGHRAQPGRKAGLEEHNLSFS